VAWREEARREVGVVEEARRWRRPAESVREAGVREEGVREEVLVVGEEIVVLAALEEELLEDTIYRASC
jgi:hypothetical protein